MMELKPLKWVKPRSKSAIIQSAKFFGIEFIVRWGRNGLVTLEMVVGGRVTDRKTGFNTAEEAKYFAEDIYVNRFINKYFKKRNLNKG